MTDHMVVGREEWEAAHNELLQREKEQTRVGDELARQRRELPWVAIEKEYQFDTDNGPRTLAELFDGRSQLLIYHFMFGPSYEAGCPTCSSMADGMNGLLPHLHARDLTLAFVSRAPIERLQARRPTADRASERGRDRDRCPRIHLGNTGGQRLQARGRRRLPDLCDHVARGRVPDGLLPDPRPGAKGAR
jgi:Bacterial protein of unknown function (DUF899)